MTAEQFAYWLQGYAELNDAPPTAEQWQAVRDHLATVFTKVTPLMGRLQVPNQWVPSETSAAPNTYPARAVC